MPNYLERAANYLQDKMEVNASVEVTYERPGEGFVSWVDADGVIHDTVPAIVGETRFTQDTQTGVMDRIVQRDYTIRQSVMMINGIRIIPKRQDVIRQPVGGGFYESRVMGEAGLPHYQESDGYGVAWRIHTKRDEVLCHGA